MLFAVAMIMVVDRVNISIAAPQIMREFGFDKVQMGWMFSSFVTGYAIANVVGGWLSDRFGSRTALAAAISGWSVFTVLTAVAGNIRAPIWVSAMSAFMIARLLVGLGEGAASPNYMRVLSRWLPQSERGRALGLVWGGMATAYGATPPLVAFCSVRWGWRSSFIAAGAVGLVLALTWFVGFRDTPELHPRVNVREVELINKERLSTRDSTLSWRSIYRVFACSRDLKLLCVVAFFIAYCNYVFFAWLFVYFVEGRGLQLITAGFTTSAPFAASAVATPLGGWLSDRLSSRFGSRVGRCFLAGGCCLIAALAILIGAFVTNPIWAVAALTVGAALTFLVSGLLFLAVVDVVGSSVGTISGIVVAVSQLGAVFAPIVTPLVADRFGWSTAIAVAAAATLTCGIAWAGVRMRVPSSASGAPIGAQESLNGFIIPTSQINRS